ncbi:MAG: response regulator [Vicinamibacterales bacterium]
MRIVIADDSVLLRRGVEALLTEAGHELVAAVGDAGALLEAATTLRPDVCIVDIRMPPSHTDEGLRAARAIRGLPGPVAVLVLSQFVDGDYVQELLDGAATHVGYLLKDTLLDGDELLVAVRRVAAGGVVVDAKLVRELFAHRSRRDELQRLSPRELEVLRLLAEGLTDRAVADRLQIGLRTVQAHTSAIFSKLDLGEDPSSNRRVLAVLTWLRHHQP